MTRASAYAAAACGGDQQPFVVATTCDGAAAHGVLGILLQAFLDRRIGRECELRVGTP